MRLLQRRFLFRLGAGAAAAMAAASVVAVSGAAHAEAGGADLVVTVPGAAVVQDAGKPFAINVHNNGPGKATGIKLVIDTRKLDRAKLEVLEPSELAGCTVKDWVFTCPVPDLPAGGNYNGFKRSDPESPVPDLSVRSIGDTGAAGRFTVSVRSTTADPDKSNNQARTNVKVVKRGIDMVAWAQDVYASTNGAQRIKPGQSGELVWMLWNQGKKPVEGVEYTVVLPHYLTFDPLRPECTYEADNTVAHCQKPDVIVGSGEAFGSVMPDDPERLDPIMVRAAANAPGPIPLAGGIVTGHAVKVCGADCGPERTSVLRSSTTSQRAGVLSAAEATKVKDSARSRSAARTTRDADPGDNSAPFSAFTARNPADLSISATPVSGHVGDTVKVDLTVTNAGPADALATRVVLTAPSGTEFVSVDREVCTAVTEGKEYTCDLGTAPTGATGSDTLGLRIVSGTVTDGKAEVSSSVDDPNPGDNTAPIKVTVLIDSTSPSAPASPSAGATPPSAGPSAPRAGGAGGGLPVTGTPVGLTSALGLGIAAVGGVLVVLARRRREVSVPPTD